MGFEYGGLGRRERNAYVRERPTFKTAHAGTYYTLMTVPEAFVEVSQ